MALHMPVSLCTRWAIVCGRVGFPIRCDAGDSSAHMISHCASGADIVVRSKRMVNHWPLYGCTLEHPLRFVLRALSVVYSYKSVVL